MTEVQGLALLLVVLYAVECVLWVPRGNLAVHSRWGRRCRIAEPDALFGNHRGGVLLLSPLPGLGRAYLCSAAADDGSRLTRDLEEARRRSAAFEAAVWPVHLSGAALLALPALLTPLLTWWLGWARVWPALVLLLLAGWAAAVVTFVTAHRQLYPRARSERRTRAVLLAVSPLAAMRAGDELAKHLFGGLHPLAVVLAVGRRPAALAMARAHLVDAAGAVAGAPPDRARPGAVEEAVRLGGYTLEEVTASPERESPRSLAFCPRCHAQYTVAGGTCEACGGLALRGFQETVSRGDRSRAPGAAR